jgi:transposase
MLWELQVAEQRYGAVRKVLDGASVIEVARRFGVSRQSVHAWLRRHAAEGGLGGLGDRSSRPHACPHQTSPVVEARIVGIRRAHPAWGADRIRYQLEKDGIGPVPGRTSVYRALVRHGLVAAARDPRADPHRQWEGVHRPLRAGRLERGGVV